MSYSALAGAFLFTCLLLWQQVRFSLSPLEQAYLGDYVRARTGTAFHLNGCYRLVYLGGGKARPRLAFPFDVTRGHMTLPSGKTAPFALAELTQSQGYEFPFRAPARKYIDASMYRWFHDVVFDGRSLLAVFALRLICGGIALIAALGFAIPADIKRFRQMKYGRVLRGPVMLTPRQFNRAAKGEGVGFVTTESRRMMRIPRRKEAQHFQIMGDTGVGKSQLIMQILRQIRDRKESAILHFNGLNIEPKVLGMRDRIGRVFDRHWVRRVVFLIQKSRQPENPVAIRASWVAAEGESQHFEHAFLQRKGEAFNAPKYLVFASGCLYDCGRNRHGIGRPKLGEFRPSIRVQIEVQVPDHCDAVFRAISAAGPQRIRSHVHIRPGCVLASQPPEIARGKRALPRDNSLDSLGRSLALEEYCERFSGRKGSTQELSSNVHRNLFSKLGHVPPRILAR
jgi:hypothetical protein